MKCPEAREALPAHARDGHASLALRRHLSRCADCRAELARYELLLGSLAELRSVTAQPPARLFDALAAISRDASAAQTVLWRAGAMTGHLSRNRAAYLSGLGVALAGAAGALLGLAFNRLDPLMGNEVEQAGLTVIIVGGMGSVGGAALAAFLVGMLRVMSVAYLDSSFRDAFVFALLIGVLLVRPSGLFGRGRAVRA